ncbi:YaaC-like Protein [Alicyclobacillus macrosporangiidus]|uniref:YaaC-like Protein n=1 Tax=Alicyclobacillus macrosporangiidus TaxID=392015 RepID=A0A1I7L100_9BACL|nr:YaaC-like Protein [Alicyclobacillus macrosporangiidus]
MIEPFQWTSEPLLRRFIARLHPDATPSQVYEMASKSGASASLGVTFLNVALRTDLCVMPLLAYYGWLHWVKAVLYALDPGYPPSSAVLQHGLSVRRQKRPVYRWLDESVHVYKEGALQSLCALIAPGYPLPGRWTVGELLGQLPGLGSVLSVLAPDRLRVYPLRFQRPSAPPQSNSWSVGAGSVPFSDSMSVSGATPWPPPCPANASVTDGSCWPPLEFAASPVSAWVPRVIASHRGATLEEWRASCAQRLSRVNPPSPVNSLSNAVPQVRTEPQSTSQDTAPGEPGTYTVPEHPVCQEVFQADGAEPDGWMVIPNPCPSHPWLREFRGNWYLMDGDGDPEWCIHYAILYSLAALCRYNAREWLDIVQWQNEQDATITRAYFSCYPPHRTVSALLQAACEMSEAAMSKRPGP